jgi:hypothetical protein
MPGRPTAHAAIKTHTAVKTRTTIGQIISVLDDRNVLRAMRLLEPERESPDPSPNPDQQEGPRCVTCITRGE